MENQKLDAYIQKILSLQNQSQLNDEDLAEIAKDLGIDTKIIEKSHEAHLSKSRNFLKYQNFDDAIQELEQAIVLKPNHLEANFLFATAYAGRYEQKDKHQDKEKALVFANRCLEIKPDYEPAARLISNLKQGQQTIYRGQQDAFARTRALILGTIMFALSIFGVVFIFTLIPMSGNEKFESKLTPKPLTSNQSQIVIKSDAQIHGAVAAIGAKGSVFWVVTYIQKTIDSKILRDYELQIIDMQTQKVKKTIPLKKDVYFMESPYQDLHFIAGKIYAFDNNKKDFEAWDIYSGDVVENKSILQNRFQELNKGIGTVEPVNQSWLNITLRNGSKYRYSFLFNTLYSEEEAKKIEADYKGKQGWKEKFIWVADNNEAASNKKIVLYKELSNPFYFYESDYRNLRTNMMNTYQRNKNYTQISTSEAEFLESKLIYGNGEFALIAHKTEIGDEGENVLTMIDGKTGKTKWELKGQVLDKSVMLKQMGKSGGGFQVSKYENTLIIFSRWFVAEQGKASAPYALAMDISNGKILWEYSPQKAE